jgi:hypothetical protein
MDSPIFDSTFGTGRFKDEKFTDPPRSDVSAGLIEAEVMKTAELYAGRLHACLLGAGFEPPRQQWLAAHFRDAITSYFRTRANDRNPDRHAANLISTEQKHSMRPPELSAPALPTGARNERLYTT